MDEKIELSDIEIQQLKEQNQERVKKVVAYVAISLTVISIILVALSLSFGPKIDSLVNDQLDRRLISKELILGPNPNISIT
uniref:Col_cuticle_N domain-containing protein n=1 Tax=Parastrongyloides trichosuri TaxID=131310 RepID=A0A0N5A4Y2_PARTI